MKRLLFDLEADGLLPTITRIHCIAACDIDTRERFDWGPAQIPEALETLEKANILVAHNGLGYDYPALEKLHGLKLPLAKKRDSLVIARLKYPNLRDTDTKRVERGTLSPKEHGKHSIKAWGQRLGVHKGDFEGPWDKWTPEMHAYMIQDVGVLEALWDHLKPDAYSQQAIDLEHRIQALCLMITEAGWPFDIERAGKLHAALVAKLEPIERQLRDEFGYWFEPTTKKQVEFEGQKVYEWFTPKVNNSRLGYVAGQPVTKLKRVEFNPGSRPHIVRCLMRRGWKPERFTESGLPALDDAVLEKLAEDFPEGGSLVEYLMLDKRIGQLATGKEAWLQKVGPSGKIHGSINPMGTSSSRASHSNPNLGQVPKVGSPYGAECRGLFVVPRGWKLGGADQAGLQLRCLGHYLAPFDGGTYGTAVATGDPHWRAVQAIGFTDAELVSDKANPIHKLHKVYRDKAKTLTYATVFGCRDKKAGSVIRDACVMARNEGWPEDYERYFGKGQSDSTVGKPVRSRFYEALGLDRLLNKLEGIRQDLNGWIKALDGRYVPAKTEHSALAFLLQSAEAIICKQWICDAYDALIAKGLKWGWDGDFVFVGWIHDELQFAAREEIIDQVADVVTACAVNAGPKLGFRVPLSSDAKVGNNWAETH